MRDLYMKNGDGFLLLYSVTSRASLKEIISLRDSILRVKNMASVRSFAGHSQCGRVHWI
jgi:GTPase SAR1 family protein